MRNGPDDEELLGRLAAAFAVEDVEPDAASLRVLSASVAQRWAPAGPTRRHQWWASRRRLSPVVIGATLAGALVTGTGISYAVGVPITSAVRSVARSVGLVAPAPPVVPPAVSQAESTLRQALASGSPPRSVVLRDSTVLARNLNQTQGSRAPGAQRANTDGHQLLIQACQYMTQPGQNASTSTTSTSTVPPASRCPVSYPSKPSSSPSHPVSNNGTATSPRPGPSGPPAPVQHHGAGTGTSTGGGASTGGGSTSTTPGPGGSSTGGHQGGSTGSGAHGGTGNPAGHTSAPPATSSPHDTSAQHAAARGTQSGGANPAGAAKTT
jgi:hypothetical protein